MLNEASEEIHPSTWGMLPNASLLIVGGCFNTLESLFSFVIIIALKKTSKASALVLYMCYYYYYYYY